MKMMQGLIVLVPIVMLLTACVGGGSSDDGDSEDGATVFIGKFLGPAVAGLSYSCFDPQSQTSLDDPLPFTDPVGSYTCQEDNQTIEFSINGYSIGSTAFSDLLTPYDLSTDPVVVTNIAQLLQTLDSDGDVSNGITIEQSGAMFDAMGTLSVALDDPDFDAIVSTALGKNIVDETTAMSALDAAIPNDEFSADTIKAALAGRTAYPSLYAQLIQDGELYFSSDETSSKQEWIFAADGLSAKMSGVDYWGSWSGKVKIGYSDGYFTVTGEETKTFVVLAITDTYMDTTQGKLYFTNQEDAYSDVISASLAGKSFGLGDVSYTGEAIGGGSQFHVSVDGENADILIMNGSSNETVHLYITYNGNTITFTNQDTPETSYAWSISMLATWGMRLEDANHNEYQTGWQSF